MNKNLFTELNQQINEELYSAYLYLAMAAYFQNQNLEGFAHWLKLQAKEELEHALKFFNFLLERQEQPELKKIESPKNNWESPLNAFSEVLKHEQHISARIHQLYALAQQEKDYPTEVMLHWFIKEQVEEENNASSILEKLKMVANSPNGILIIDRELSQRSGD